VLGLNCHIGELCQRIAWGGHVNFIALNKAPDREEGSSQAAVTKLATLLHFLAVVAPAAKAG